MVEFGPSPSKRARDHKTLSENPFERLPLIPDIPQAEKSTVHLQLDDPFSFDGVPRLNIHEHKKKKEGRVFTLLETLTTRADVNNITQNFVTNKRSSQYKSLKLAELTKLAITNKLANEKQKRYKAVKELREKSTPGAIFDVVDVVKIERKKKQQPAQPVPVIEIDEDARMKQYLSMVNDYFKSQPEEMRTISSKDLKKAGHRFTPTVHERKLKDKNIVASTQMTTSVPVDALPSKEQNQEDADNEEDDKDFVYDVYIQEENPTGNESIAAVVQLDSDDDLVDDTQNSDYDSDDSNAEENPANDYPDEEAENGEDTDEKDGDQEFNDLSSEEDIYNENSKVDMNRYAFDPEDEEMDEDEDSYINDASRKLSLMQLGRGKNDNKITYKQRSLQKDKDEEIEEYDDQQAFEIDENNLI